MPLQLSQSPLSSLQLLGAQVVVASFASCHMINAPSSFDSTQHVLAKTA
jgi:hypothetical protein